jgi:hypothetical protein
MFRKILAWSAVIAAIATPCAAQTVSLSPSVVQLKGHAGQSATQTLRMTNMTSGDLTFALEAQDVVVRDGKRMFLRAGQIAGSIAGTAVFSEKSVTVPVGEARTASVTFTVPENPSVRAVVAFFRAKTTIASGTLAATASLGTLFTFTLSEEVSLEAEGPVVVAPSATTNTVVAQSFLNIGTEPTVVKGVAVILSAEGVLIGKTLFEPKRALPGEHVTLRAEYAGEIPTGHYRVLLTFEFGGKSLTRIADLVVL